MRDTRLTRQRRVLFRCGRDALRNGEFRDLFSWAARRLRGLGDGGFAFTRDYPDLFGDEEYVPLFESFQVYATDKGRCFTHDSNPVGSLSFPGSPEGGEVGWAQCATPNEADFPATDFRFDLAKVGKGIGDDSLLRVEGTFGVEVGSFHGGARAHWIVSLAAGADRRAVCSVPSNGEPADTPIVVVGPGACVLPGEVPPKFRTGRLLVRQILDEPRTDKSLDRSLKKEVFGGIVDPMLVVR